MNDTNPPIAEQLALVASRLQAQRTGHAPEAVTVVLSDAQDCLIIVITGRGDHQRRQQCIEAGIDLLLFTRVDSAVVDMLLPLGRIQIGLR